MENNTLLAKLEKMVLGSLNTKQLMFDIELTILKSDGTTEKIIKQATVDMSPYLSDASTSSCGFAYDKATDTIKPGAFARSRTYYITLDKSLDGGFGYVYLYVPMEYDFNNEYTILCSLTQLLSDATGTYIPLYYITQDRETIIDLRAAPVVPMWENY